MIDMMNLLAQTATTAASTAPADTTVGTPLDYVVIVAYLALILGFGSFFGRYAKSTRDFFFSGSRFSWWLIGMSMVATGVGSHSFLKYAQKGYEHGLSSGMTYTNDWFFIPFFMFGWLPIIYFARCKSIPEYFERRFNTPARFFAVLSLLMLMVGYIGYNLFTLATAANQIIGIQIPVAIVIVSCISGVYITAGGQTAVIFTDLLQGFMLLTAGLLLFALGLDYLAFDGAFLDGVKTFWANLSLADRLPHAGFNKPNNFNFVGVFWQDGVAGSIAFLFVNQGVIMRFLAAKSVNEGRKAILFNTVFILPLSMIVVGNAGWLCKVVDGIGPEGWVGPGDDASLAFVKLSSFVCHPGVFGFILAALAAALMSTIDTLTNATAALFVYDVYQPYLKPEKNDKHYMRVARITSACVALGGLGIGLYFAGFGKDLYKVHGMFQAFVSPPIVAAVFMGAFWKRFTSAGAVGALAGGMICILASKVWPQIVAPFSHGVEPDSNGQYSFMTACFGLVCSAGIGVIVSLFTKPKTEKELAGLWVGSINLGQTFFKGGKVNHEVGEKIRAALRVSEEGTCGPDDEPIVMPDAPSSQPASAYPVVRLSQADMDRMKAKEGDLLFVGDARQWLGGLRSSHCRVGAPHNEGNVVLMAQAAFEAGSFLPDRDVRVEMVF